MKDIFMLIRRFIAPYYKGYLSLAVLFNILSALLNLVAFALVMPILNILFQIEERVTTYIPFSSLDLTTQAGWSQMKEVVTNNFGYFVSQLIETEGASYTLIILGIYLVLMTLLKVGATYLGGFFLVPIRTGVVRDLRNQLNAKILALPLGFFSEERKGDVLARITGDVGEVENSVMSSLDLLLKNPILIFVYLGSMLVISWQLTLFVFLVLPIAGFVMGRVGKSLKRTSLEAQNQWGQLISQVEETLGGLRIVKAFTAEEFVDKRFRDSNEEYRQTVIGVNRRQLLAHPVSELLGTATIAIVLWYGGSLILNRDSSIDASTFIYYLVIFYSLINPLKDLSKGAYAIRRGMGSMERVDRILQAESTITDPAEPKPVVFNEAIRLEKVSFRYAEEWVLRDVDLTIRKGQTVALVGHSGSGKSTLVDLIPRFYDVVEGRITIDGTDIREVAVADLRRLMGNVNQEPILFNASVFENIAFGVEGATLEKVRQAAEVAHADEFINEMPAGYDTNIGDRGGKLSGGQRQRLSIARAVYKNPPILILDEATSALDTKSERLVQSALDHLMEGRTTIVIAHRLSTIIHADVICVVDDGRIVEQGTHDELLALGGHYAKLHAIQVKS
ncbi:MAG: ABC transporter ATP-binding protein [Porphyromonas sp.]|jgi:ABC transporter, ATP-binding protein, msbA family|uniref:ABC transporter ATP-binding protein n=1 Tax=Porphyromonas pasteri TaxID=1583331 RepID=A0ABQ2H8T1_9PORP|nr:MULTISPECIES: ABC transporter ATP-binding protein [Porphyromonas]MBF1368685.1 ABC transporter ATP-binding protein [Porphyromonadaceae bacterium]MBF1371661.1 ABC transporter ATP-binding protein [Porphyromonas sp.]MBF1377315.1 ABC transporter ATP-binding protein [Porphyromonadaceae bacterium]MBF1380377.1 ABC transporter ATP-binding protein [Porphyromonadaceae bacterium]MBF1396102.1 ABC transporter ATP-binding protein [Porphyromonas sp.]